MRIPTHTYNLKAALTKLQTHRTMTITPIFSANDIPPLDSTPHGITYRLIESPTASTPSLDTHLQSNTFAGNCFGYSLNLCTSQMHNNAIGVVRKPMTSLGTEGNLRVGDIVILNGNTQEQWKVSDMRYAPSVNNHATYRITSTRDGCTLRLHTPFAWSYEICNCKEASKTLENYHGQGYDTYFFY